MDFTTYKKLMGRISKSCVVPHHAYPGHNIVPADILQQISKDLNNINEFSILEKKNEFLSKIPCYDKFIYSVETCYPFFCGSTMEDVAAKTLRRKLSWERKLTLVKLSNVKGAVKCIRDLKNRKPIHPTKKLIRYLEHFRKDPEPYFIGNYNWMYTGGNLAAVPFDSNIILLSADRSNALTQINIFFLNTETDSPRLIKKLMLKRNFPILQICAKGKDDSLLIGVRQKNFFNLHRINDADKCDLMDCLWKKKVRGSKFLTSIDISDDFREAIALDTKGDLNMYDIESRRKMFGCARRFKSRDCWNHAKYKDDKVYIATRNHLYIIDPKDGTGDPFFKFTPSEAVNGCDEICSMTCGSLDPNYLYAATTHHFLQADMRTGKIVQRWTHMMKRSPLYLNCLEHDGNDFLILQSPLSEETVGIVNGYANDDEDSPYFFSRYLPRALKGPKNALKEAQTRGLCLSPHTSKRFDFTVTGVQCVKGKEGDIYLYTVNCGGDVFFSRIVKKIEGSRKGSSEGEKTFLEKMKDYEIRSEQVWREKSSNRKLKLENLNEICKDLKRVKMSYQKRKRQKFWKYEEMYSEPSLVLYRDVMSQRILKIWGISNEEEGEGGGEEEEEDDENEIKEPVCYVEKIQNWMDTF